ncbi:MAG: PLP-dependent aminotransferase family protein, partial [Gemmatimonadales bacterium]
LYTALRAAILEGRLRPGARLPSTRELAGHYGLSRGTIVGAFEQLKSEGYLEAIVGSGTRVAEIIPEALLQAGARPRGRTPDARDRPRPVSRYGGRVRRFESFPPGPVRAFRTNQPALDLFPTSLWAQVASRRLRRATTADLLSCDPLGYPPLREAVADYLTTSRGVCCVPEQIAIVSGAQEALDLAARLLLDPGDRVAMEDPGYSGARTVFEAAGAAVAPVPLDDEGITLGTLEGARLVYVTPAHQFPIGVAMSLPRRLALLNWAGSSGALILEDDYDSEFRYSGRPLPALQGLDRHGQVIFAGSFSKVLFPSLRVGYLVVPPDLVDRFAAVLSVTRRHAPLLEQAVVADFIAAGHFGRHVRRMRQVYAERLSVLLQCARERLAGLLELSPVEAGLQTAGRLHGGMDDEAAARAAAEREVEVWPLSRYCRRNPAGPGLLLGFGAVDAREIRRATGDLALALEGLAARRH